MWGRMKSLEGKYIDLANYYKQELMTSQQRPNADGGASSASSKSAVGGVVPQRDGQSFQGQHPGVHATFESSRVPFPQTIGRTGGSIEQLDGSSMHNEDNLINELKSEKQRFEQNMQQIMTGSVVEDTSMDRAGAFQSHR